MRIPIFFLIIVFVIWLGYEVKKNTGQHIKESRAFWDREKESFLTPRKSTEDIHYIELTEDIIPPEILDAEAESAVRANELSAELRTFIGKKIADLSEYTNTDLRIKYGAPNFNELWDADNNFARLVQIMPKLIEALLDSGMTSEASELMAFCDASGISSTELTRLRNML